MMKLESYINYQGSKSNIMDFIISGIKEFTNPGDRILDIFSGSGAVSLKLSNKYDVISNDVEPYSATISKAILYQHKISVEDIDIIIKNAKKHISYLKDKESLKNILKQEQLYIETNNLEEILKLYKNYQTVWNSKEITPSNLHSKNQYNLFTRYYATSYFGIRQALEIDSIIYSISQWDEDIDLLYACLFYAMKETVFSRDGHMAQPLNFEKFSKRGFEFRGKDVLRFFEKKLIEVLNTKEKNLTRGEVYNLNFEELLKNDSIMKSVDLIYADPPYTDMQYSRYYHILNVARLYNYPELTVTSRGYTAGLYTEGRFQSDLSKKSKAKEQIRYLMEKTHKYNKNLALSYAYPRNIKTQATDRYTISIEELLVMAKETFGSEYVKINQINYMHSNNKGKKGKPVIEYLIICGKNKNIQMAYDINKTKKQLLDIKPTNRNPMYNTHLYWSQKSFNIIDILINNFSKPGDKIFDPFMGSGVTVLEAVKNKSNRNGIGCDINEMPLFIVQTLLKSSFNEIALHELKDLASNINSLLEYYKTYCPECGNEAIVDRVIFDKPVRNKNDISIKNINLECEKCSIKNTDYIKEKVEKDMYREYSYKNVNTEYSLIKNSKIAVIEGDMITNIFTNRNLKVIDEIIELSFKYSNDTQDIIKYILMSIMHQCKITDKRSNSQWPLWIPKKDCVERNVVFLFSRKLQNFLKSTKFIHKNYKNNSIVESFNCLDNNKAMLLHKGSQYISDLEIPNDGIDLIITDPPYLEQVLYSEYMQLYSPTLGLSYNLEDEIVVSRGENRNKDKDNYYLLLKDVFDLCSKKLKENSLLCLFFHDSNLSVWNKLIKILYECGFEFMGQVHIKKNVTLKNIISPKKSLNGDSVLFFNNTKLYRSYNNGPESIEEIELNIINETKHMLRSNGPLSTPELYDNGLMEILIQNEWLSKVSKKYKTLIELFEKHILWDKSIGKWKLSEKE